MDNDLKDELKNSVLKTGTSIVGIVCTDGVILAADRQVSAGTIVMNKDFMKIIPISDKALTAITGGVSDAQFLMRIVAAELRLKELKSRQQSTVKETASLLASLTFRNIRTPSMIPQIAHFLLAGYDEGGLALFEISPDGFLKKERGYVASGSGIMQAHPILDSEYKPDITIEEGVKLITKCIRASMGRDPGVGAGIDIYTIKKGEIKEVFGKEAITEFR